VGRGDGRRPPLDQLEPPVSPPDESPAEELLAADDEASGADEADDDPSVVAGSSAVVPVVEVAGPLLRCGRPRGCSVAPSESRTTGRGVTGRKVGFTRSEVDSAAEAEGTLAAVCLIDTSSASAVPVTSLVDGAVFVDACPFSVAGSVEPNCSVWVGPSVRVAVSVGIR
jgi:hypothetical protein